jgi:hypothetical protein
MRRQTRFTAGCGNLDSTWEACWRYISGAEAPLISPAFELTERLRLAEAGISALSRSACSARRRKRPTARQGVY